MNYMYSLTVGGLQENSADYNCDDDISTVKVAEVKVTRSKSRRSKSLRSKSLRS